MLAAIDGEYGVRFFQWCTIRGANDRRQCWLTTPESRPGLSGYSPITPVIALLPRLARVNASPIHQALSGRFLQSLARRQLLDMALYLAG